MFRFKGRPLYLLDAEAGGGSGGDEGGEGDEGGKPAPKADAITQADLTRVGTQQKAEGRRAAEKAIADKLGVTVDEAVDLIAEAKAAKEANDTEADKARRKAEADSKTAADATAAAAQERHDARVERALIAAGVTAGLDDEAADKKLARLARLVDAEVGDDLDVIKANVADLKKDEPGLFAVADAGDGEDDDEEEEVDPITGKPKKTTAPNSDPKVKKGKNKKTEDAFARGAERAKSGAGDGSYPILGGTGGAAPVDA